MIRNFVSIPLLLAIAPLAPAADAVVSPRVDKMMAEELTAYFVKAAHPSVAKCRYLKHAVEKRTGDRLVWTILVEYEGSLTGNRYEADVVVKLTGKPGEYDVDDIEFLDLNNKVPANEANLLKLRRPIGKVINELK